MTGARRVQVPGYDEVWRVPCADTVAFVALHSLRDGMAFGGIRILPYTSEADALQDAQDLARAMTAKLRIAEVPGGGAKAVLMAPEHDRRRAVADLARFVETLGGRYHAGPDMGFSDEDERVVREHTRYLADFDGLADATADGVVTAIRAVCTPEVAVVEGLGSVGSRVARSLVGGGARIVAGDVRPVEGFELTPLDQLATTACDVFAPCAKGGGIDHDVAERLGARVVCGATNNPLTELGVADVLHDRGIDLVPDFVANAGAVLVGLSRALGQEALIPERLAAIGPRAAELVEAGRRERRSPQRIALERAQYRDR